MPRLKLWISVVPVVFTFLFLSITPVRAAVISFSGQLGSIDEAESCCRRALALRPDYGEAHMNMGNIMLAINPANPLARFSFNSVSVIISPPAF